MSPELHAAAQWSRMSPVSVSQDYRLLQVQSAGYKYLSSKVKDEKDADAAQKAEDDFLMCLDKMEGQLSKHKGPYLVG